MKLLALAAALTVCLATGARAGTPEPIAPERAPSPLSHPTQSLQQLGPRLSLQAAEAMVAEMRALFDAQLADEERAVAAMATASAEEREALALRMRQAAEELNLELLRVQLRYAQEAGLTEQVQRLEAGIAAQMELRALPTHVDASTLGKSERQPSIPTPPAARPVEEAKDKGFAEGGEGR